MAPVKWPAIRDPRTPALATVPRALAERAVVAQHRAASSSHGPAVNRARRRESTTAAAHERVPLRRLPTGPCSFRHRASLVEDHASPYRRKCPATDGAAGPQSRDAHASARSGGGVPYRPVRSCARAVVVPALHSLFTPVSRAAPRLSGRAAMRRRSGPHDTPSGDLVASSPTPTSASRSPARHRPVRP